MVTDTSAWGDYAEPFQRIASLVARLRASNHQPSGILLPRRLVEGPPPTTLFGLPVRVTDDEEPQVAIWAAP